MEKGGIIGSSQVNWVFINPILPGSRGHQTVGFSQVKWVYSLTHFSLDTDDINSFLPGSRITTAVEGIKSPANDDIKSLILNAIL